MKTSHCKAMLLLVFVGVVLWLGGCHRSHNQPLKNTTDPAENLRALWQIVDEGYCFFPEKFPDEKDWENSYYRYAAQLTDHTTEDQLFDLMAQMLAELRDGHVNLFAPFDVSSYNHWAYSSANFFDANARQRYLGNRYRLAGSLYYTTIDYNGHEPDSVGLIVCNSFGKSISLQHWHAVFKRLSHCRGIIIDLRNNGGGLVSNAETMASLFLTQKKRVAYISTKTGPGHRQFSPLSPIDVEPAPKAVRWSKPMVLLTNRRIYSAGNLVTAYLKHAPQVTIVGDTTGGGGGLPFSAELPNGWWLRYSGSRTYDSNKELLEWGVAPHVVVPQTDEASAKQEDSLIEYAIDLLLTKSRR